MISIQICAGWLALLAPIAGCAATRVAVPAPAGMVASAPGDTSAIAAALGFFASRSEGVIQVDPRPLRSDASLQGITARDLDTGDEAAVRARAAFLRGRGIAATDAAADMGCAFARGVPPTDGVLRLEPDSVRSRRRACLARGLYTTYAFGPGASDSTTGAVRMRAYRLTTWSFEVWDISLRAGEHGFEVIGGRRLGGVAS